MYYNRLELRLMSRGWTGGQLLEGAVEGNVRGVAIEASSRQIEFTLVQPRRGAQRHQAITRSAGNARTQLATDLVRITSRTRVEAEGVPVGWVSRLWCDRGSRELTHVLVQTRHSLLVRSFERIVEVGIVKSLAEGKVVLLTSASGFTALPPHRSDGDILADVRLIFQSALPDPHARRAIKLRVDDAEVTLAGQVDTPEQRASAAHAAGSIAGVRGVVNDIVITETMATAVEAAIAAAFPDKRATAGVRVFSEHGIVYLEGKIADPSVRAALERTAVAVPGVRVVVNNLLVEGESPERGRETGPLTRFR
jgi:osmotically-inducible protein OsmY